MQPITVSELTKRISSALSVPAFQSLAVEGEISNFVHHASGHMYFSLKDAHSRVKAVMFRSRNRLLNFLPKNGETVIAVGSVGVYEPSGEYQLYVEMLFPKGTGDLHLAFEKLKAKLEAEGLFDAARKRPLPLLPRKVGVITSPSGAALRDIIRVLTRRFPAVQILVFPALVQGEGAPESLIKALQLAQDTDCDVLIMGRGGGSFEELNAFNDEQLARAIANSAIPVVSAVGHETDFTIADFVADLRAPTPSAAAELVVPLQEELQRAVTSAAKRLVGALRRQISAERRFLTQLASSAALQRPDYRVNQLRQRLDDLFTNLTLHNTHKLALRRSQLGNLAGRLETLSPLQTLARGYAICSDAEGHVLRSADQVQPGDAVNVTLYAGLLLCRVEGRKCP
ncbi:MAG TPA: exodeoxyribonuclease VII large subunit [Limnochordia bacterium]|nr:exodeoxyribonuclease VII large subunit [Limnochordia bacterium]